MLLANQQVAKRISTYFPEAALLRNHVNPLLRKLETFVKFCSKHISNSSVNISSAKSLGQSLEELKRTQSPHIFYALQLLATRAMQLAKYFCTGDMDNDDGWKHYALNVDRYTHFTRYYYLLLFLLFFIIFNFFLLFIIYYFFIFNYLLLFIIYYYFYYFIIIYF